MADPTVTAVCLTCDRPQMVQRAVRAFQAQTYKQKRLLVLDTGMGVKKPDKQPGITWIKLSVTGLSIGALRNLANGMAGAADILVHWDDDDYSDPMRIEEQVALLRSAPSDCVGYRDMLVWREPEAWLYSNPNPTYALGTSLCYWREVWWGNQFPDRNIGEDELWRITLKCVGESSLHGKFRPRMVAQIHGGNTSLHIPEHKQWRRAPEWDQYCRETMA